MNAARTADVQVALVDVGHEPAQRTASSGACERGPTTS